MDAKENIKAIADRLAGVKLEQAAQAADRHTEPGRETAARLITQANAIKKGVPIPVYAQLAKGH